MKRLFPAVFALVLFFFGCSKEISESIPNASSEVESCIRIVSLTEDTDFGAFTAGPPDPAQAGAAEELVLTVLGQYPPGFPEQWGPVEILLAGGLTGEEQFAHGRYAGFTRRTDGRWQVVLDAAACDAGTVHHEIAHILDGILTEAGVLTEAAWMRFCPGDFSYGQRNFDDFPDFFTDAYAMQTIREDRARTFEDAVLCGAGVYDDRPALWLKLELFSRAIRTHFDTAQWPEKTIWELALD